MTVDAILASQTETLIQENRKVTEVKSAVSLRNTCPWPVELAVHPRQGGYVSFAVFILSARLVLVGLLVRR